MEDEENEIDEQKIRDTCEIIIKFMEDRGVDFKIGLSAMVNTICILILNVLEMDPTLFKTLLEKVLKDYTNAYRDKFPSRKVTANER